MTRSISIALADKFGLGWGNLYKTAKRSVKLLLAIWMIGDMIMDGYTTKKYYDIARVSALDVKYEAS